MRNFVVYLAAGLLFVGGGCGDAVKGKAKLYPVKGKVTGPKSYADCTVSFVSDEGKIFGSKIGADGSYQLTDADGREGGEPGKYKIVLQVSPEAMQKAMMSGAMGGGAGGPPKTEAPFPDEFSDASTSPKEVEIKAESNTIDIAIP